MIRTGSLALLAAASVLVSACGGDTSDPPAPPASAPVIASFAASPTSITAGGTSSLSWSVTGATSLSVDNGIGTVTGTSRAVTPASTTTYRLTATGPGGTDTATATVTVSAVAPPVIASFAASPTSITAGGTSTLSWSVTGATSLSIDNGIGTVTGTSRAVTPATTTTYVLTATGSGGTSSAQATVTVTPPPASPLEVACSGAGCGAASATTYSGTGIGVWRRRNAGATAETVSFTLDGVRAGQSVLLLFSNGAERATSLPDAGPAGDPALDVVALAMPPAVPPGLDPAEEAADRAGTWMTERNRAEAEAALALAAGPRAAMALPAPAVPLASPVVGDVRAWWDNYATPVSYSTVAKVVCTLPNGRKGIFWVDPAATSAGNVTDADLAYFETTFCGATGGYARVVALRGEPWGTASVVAGEPTVFIQDAAGAPQDVHVVFLNVPSSTAWGGYFYGLNNMLQSLGGNYATSNQALAFFINAPGVKVNRGYYASTLLHELTHMVNYYQRSLVKGTGYDTWLEEMSAMMTEDFLTPAVTPDAYQKVPTYRIRPYLLAGGAVNLTDWSSGVSANPYPATGTLGAFLNRRYGLSVYTGMVNCSRTVTSVGCVNSLVVAAGGTGFADELARMGASVYAVMPPSGGPAGYGFPQVVDGGATFSAVNLSTMGTRPAVASSLGAQFTATTHWYVTDTVGAGRTSYSRPGLVLPAGVTLLVVVQ